MQRKAIVVGVMGAVLGAMLRLVAQPLTVEDFTSQVLGSPPLPGGMVAVGDGVEVRGSGDLGGTTDNGQFAWREEAGDFDYRARLAGFTPTDPFAKAGLMVRENFTPNGRMVAALATPGTVGCFGQWRTTAGLSTARSGYLPVNYPETWLRLRRVGSVFTAFAGFDGVTWTELGSASIVLPDALYFGLAVAGRSTGSVAVVTFQGIERSTNGLVAGFVATGEVMGPSSRQTALAISEVMYHPAERGDGRDGEYVEIYNADLIPFDLTGFRLTGSIEFAFPAGAVLPAGGYGVVAGRPSDFAAVYGGVANWGPFEGTNGLPNDSGVIRLANARGTWLLEAHYDTRSPWPLAADGAGHSLVLARPSYGEGDARAWAASAEMGGSPGRMETVRANGLEAVRINEVLAHTDDPVEDFVELYNHSGEAVDVSRCILTDDLATNRFRLPTGSVLTPRGFLAFGQRQLGFRLNAAGETLWLFDSNRTRVVDAVRFGGQENGVASGRYPDGVAEMRRLTAPSPGAENLPFRVDAVAINEILYHPISVDSDDEFVELYNRGTQAVDLTGWRLTDGIEFTFPNGSVLEGGGYLAVARNRVRLLANHPEVAASRVYGDFDGALSNSGERLALTKPDWVVVTNEFGLSVSNRIDIDVDEVTYGTGGRWGDWSDGLGSSLELIDANSDHLRASNWADSDESGKAAWGTIENTGRLDNGDGGLANRLQITLQGPGECLIDNIEVFPTGGTNRVSNPGFESALTGWTIRGNHRASTRESQGGVGNSPCLHIRATGRGDTACNRIHAIINPTLAVNQDATLRARVRWLKGWPELLLRTRGNYLEASGRMPVPGNLGTPAARNSRAVTNAGPAIFEVSHRPVLPNAGEAVVVTARVSDPDGVGAVRLLQRVEPGTAVVTTAMVDDGTEGDAVAGDGWYSARIEGRTAGVKLAFWIEAADRCAGGSSTNRFPSDAPVRECLVKWGDVRPFGNLGVYRLWQRSADYNLLRSREILANDPLDCTFVYNDGRVVYNVEMRAKGSPWHSGSVGSDYLFTFPEDDRLLGARDMALVMVGNLGNDPSLQREQAAFWIGEQMGLPVLHRRHVYFYENGVRKGTVYEDTEEPNGLYADRNWPEGPDGDLFKIEDWFEFDDSGTSFTFNRDATLEPFTTVGGGYKLARYRWDWRMRAVVDSANDYTNLFNLVTAANLTGTNLAPRLEAMIDIDNWMGVFALQHIVGNWDAYGYNRGKNSYAYKPVSRRFGLIPWDIDFVLGSGGDGASTDIFGVNDPVIGRWWNVPVIRRSYLRAFLTAINGPLRSERFDPVVDGRYAALVASGAGASTTPSIKTWVVQRRTYLANRIASEDTAAFAVTSNNGADFSTGQSQITVTGTAPIAAAAVTVNGVPMPVTWTGTVAWSMVLSLGARTNVLQFGALDWQGRPLAALTDTVTVRYTGAELPSPAGQVVFNEIMYHPAVPDAEFIEVYNRSLTATFDLGGWRIEGAEFAFPAGTLLGPGRYAVVAGNRDGFAAAYGYGVMPVGVFAGTLQNDGERLKLVRPGATPDLDLVVDEVRYDSRLPWPVRADGAGASLQLLDARQDNWRVGNWAAAVAGAAVQATPGVANTVATVLEAFPAVLLNEVLPENTKGQADRLGDRDPWIELYNAGTTAVSLSGLYLAPNYTNLTRWAFPAGTTIPAKGFLLVWADGEAGESTAGELHANFRLAPTNGAVALVRLQAGAPAVVDYLEYRGQPADLSYGSYPDGQPQERRLFHVVTPRVANNAGAPAIEVRINEWMASNTGSVLDPADGDSDDWFELYNAGVTAVDLSAYTLTDTLSNPGKYVIPNGTTIPAGGFLVVWADEEGGQSTNGQLHANFKLGGGGEALGLYAPDGKPVDTLTFGLQANNISEGRFPDGGEAPFLSMPVPTPGRPNEFANGNRPPVLAAIGSVGVDEGQLAVFVARATDPDAGQQVTYSLVGAPTQATIGAADGEFRWVTTEADGPGEYAFAVRATDNGVPPRSDIETVRVTVREVNQAPTLEPLAEVGGAEGMPIVVQVRAADADRPSQRLRFGLASGAPAGAAIDAVSGEFAWTPGEVDGGRQYEIGVRVTDDGEPALSSSQTLVVRVAEVDDPPVFVSVGLQLISELAPFRLTLGAADPDSPPLPLAYSIESGPTGLGVDRATGVLTWTPTEEQGPNSYNVVVRADEVGGGRSGTLAFSIVVSEANQAPALGAVADRVVAEGTLLVITNTATDADLPAQQLGFSLAPGAPSGAWIDSASGVLTWAIGGDVGPSTNAITVQVSDETLDSKTTSRTFTVVVQAEPRIVINEIMYKPVVTGTAYVELHNWSTNVAWDMGGWRLTGAEFTLPAGSALGPGGYLVVAEDVARFRTAYGAGATVVGGFVNRLGSGGGVVELWRPGAGGGEVLADRVAYRTTAPWPTTANGGGASLQLIDPRQDNRPVANWAARLGSVTNAPRNVVAMDAVWRYWQAGADPAAGWTNRVYDDSQWPTGKALLYVETASLPVTKNTPLTLGPMSYLFRSRFQFDGNPEGASILLSAVLDDGAVFYLNGKAFYWLGMTDGVVPARGAAASRTVGDAVLEGPFTIVVTNLVVGENVLAAEVHQANSGSSDIVLGATLDVVDVRQEGATPGYVNSVRADLDPFPALVLNEIQVFNVAGPVDGAGDHDPWIELANLGTNTATLTGHYLSDNLGNLIRWRFPDGATLAPGAFRLAWVDGETAESTPTEWHAAFRLSGAAGVVALSRLQAGEPVVVDYLEYSGLSAGRSYGYAAPFGVTTEPGLLPVATPGGANLPPAPVIVGLERLTGGLWLLRWSAVAGLRYRLEAKSDLDQAVWDGIAEIAATGTVVTATDPSPEVEAKFYRVRVVP